MGKRFILAVVLAPIYYGVICLPGNALLMMAFPAIGEGTAAPTVLYLVLALTVSLGYAAFAGFCSAWTAADGGRQLGLWAGAVLLAVGVAVQASFWNALPVWYHIAFLATIIPLTVLGASWYRPRQQAIAE